MPSCRISVLNFIENFFPEFEAVNSLEPIIILEGFISPLEDVLFDFVILFVDEPLGYSSGEYFYERWVSLAGLGEAFDEGLCSGAFTGPADDEEGLDSVRNRRSVFRKIGF